MTPTKNKHGEARSRGRRTSSADARWPLIAIVGRPNVGKSTLFNRLTGTRRSIVGDEPGITRDRIYGVVEWGGRHARMVDTGGVLPSEQEFIPAEIFRQAKVAFDEAAAIVMVVDGRTELVAPDLELGRLLMRLGKPVFLAVNKIDAESLLAQAENFRRLGFKEMLPVSAEHGLGIGDLLNAVFAVLPEDDVAAEENEQPESEPEWRANSDEDIPEIPAHAPDEVKVAIIGRPNVGKSTLLNALTGTSRAIVSPVAGTTRDAVDELVERDGQKFRFIDTAGIRRKGKTHEMAEKLSVIMARKHLEAADVSLLVIDATAGVLAGDATIGGYAHESGRSMVIVVNKWDLVTSKRTRRKTASRPQSFRGTVTVRLEIPQLRAGNLRFRRGRPEYSAGFRHCDSRRRRTREARGNGADEPLSGTRRLRARAGAHVAKNANPLYDPGRCRAANVCVVYGSRREAAFFL